MTDLDVRSEIEQILECLQKYEWVEVDQYGNEQVWVKRKQNSPIDLETATQAILALIDRVRISELEAVEQAGYDDMHKTYDYNRIVEAVFDRLDELKLKKKGISDELDTP